MGSVLTPQFIGIEQGRPLPNASTFCGLRGGLPGPDPLPKLMRHWREGAVPAPSRPASRPLRAGLVGVLRQAAGALPLRHRRRYTHAGSDRAGRAVPVAPAGRRVDRHAGSAGAPGAHLHESVARERREAGAAGEQRPRRRPGADPARAAPHPEEQAAEAAVAARLEAKAPNLVPARGQLDRDGRVQLFAELAAAVMADVRRLGTLEDVPAAVSGYLRQHNLPQKIALAPEPLLDQANWDSQPLLRVRRGTAVDADATGVTLASRGWPRPARWCSPPAPSARPSWPTCPRPASSWWRPTGSRGPTSRPGSRCGPCRRRAALGQFRHRPLAHRRHRPEDGAGRPRAQAPPGPDRRPAPRVAGLRAWAGGRGRSRPRSGRCGTRWCAMPSRFARARHRTLPSCRKAAREDRLRRRRRCRPSRPLP